MTHKEFGEKLKGWRKFKGLLQTTAAEGAGISQPRWSDLEHGKAGRIGLDEALRIVEFTEGDIALDDFPRPVPKDESSTDLSDESIHAEAG